METVLPQYGWAVDYATAGKARAGTPRGRDRVRRLELPHGPVSTCSPGTCARSLAAPSPATTDPVTARPSSDTRDTFLLRSQEEPMRTDAATRRDRTMRGIVLTALAAATIAAADSADAQTVHWSADIRVERWVSDGGSEFFGYWRSVFGNIRGSREFEYDGVPYTVDLFYITNEPRSLLVGLEKWGSTANATLPADRGLAFMVDGVRFDLSDVTRSPGEGVVAWDDSGLDWINGQVVSVELVEGATPVPTLPLAGAALLALLLSVGIRVRLGWRPRRVG